MPTLSTPRRASVPYGVAVLGLLLTAGFAVMLPTRIHDPTCVLDCFDELNVVKVAMILLGLLVTFTGLLVGAFRSYLAQS